MSDGTAEAGSESRPIRIIVDDREPCELMLPLLEKCACFRVEVQRLPTGDYFVNDALLVERKTLPDLMQSIIEGRLFQQALRLVAAKHPAALILEGGARDLQHTQMRWEAIQGALITIALFMGLPVLRSRNPEETVQTLRLRSAPTDGRRNKHPGAPQSTTKTEGGVAILHSSGITGRGTKARATTTDAFRQC